MFNTKTHKSPSVMQHSFSQVPKAEIPRATFDRSHGYKTSFDAGWLVPFFADEVLPGDTFALRVTGFARLSTPIFPIMDNMFMDTHFFFVPLRLIWTDFPKFMGEQDNPGDSVDFIVPIMTSPGGGYASGSLSDYLGIPPLIAGIEHSALWHRAYNLVYNTWYRDQNMKDSVVVDKDAGPDTVTDYVLLRRLKRHDYFTACLPWPQKGDAVSVSLGTSAPVTLSGVNAPAKIRQAFDGSLFGATNPLRTAAGGELVAQDGASGGFLDPMGTLEADLTAVSALTINSLRQSIQIQKLLERDARGGTRYVELVRSHFQVTSPDSRLQRPEFLGGGSSPVNISPIPQTGSTDATTPQGNLAAMGTALLSGHGFTTSFTEHGVIIGIVSVRADLTYQQGLPRMFSRSTKLDFYWPALSHIGEQAVLRKEIYATGVDVDDDTVFGYQERFAEMRYKPSQVTGLFRSAAAGSLDAWHLSQVFASPPVLDGTFIEENPPVDRVIAVPAEPHFLFDSYFSLRCSRPMPVYGVPGLMDHF